MMVAPVVGFVATLLTVNAGPALTHVSVCALLPVTVTSLMMSNWLVVQGYGLGVGSGGDVEKLLGIVALNVNCADEPSVIVPVLAHVT